MNYSQDEPGGSRQSKKCVCECRVWDGPNKDREEEEEEKEDEEEGACVVVAEAGKESGG